MVGNCLGFANPLVENVEDSQMLWPKNMHHLIEVRLLSCLLRLFEILQNVFQTVLDIGVRFVWQC